MRTLRSGKPLPDTQVKRSSAGEIIQIQNSQEVEESPTTSDTSISSNEAEPVPSVSPEVVSPLPEPKLTNATPVFAVRRRPSTAFDATGSTEAAPKTPVLLIIKKTLIKDNFSTPQPSTNGNATPNSGIKSEPPIVFKRGRGRPPLPPGAKRKTPIKPIRSNDDDGSAKRGRGRPRKLPKTEDSYEMIESSPPNSPDPKADARVEEVIEENEVIKPEVKAESSDEDDQEVIDTVTPEEKEDDSSKEEEVEIPEESKLIQEDVKPEPEKAEDIKTEPVVIPIPQKTVLPETIEEKIPDKKTTEKRKMVEKKSPVPDPPTQTEPRRSLRCPKPKAAPIVQATMAVERDALDEPEACSICGEEFRKKYLLIKHIRRHKAVAAAEEEAERNQAEAESALAVDFGDDEEEEEGEYGEGMDENNCSEAGDRGMIDFTKKRPSQSSLAMSNPVKCHVCGMTFTRRAHLNRHMLLHSGVKPFQCDICKLKFTRKDHMLAHKQKHEKELKIECAQCGAGFLSWKVLQEHIKSVHTSFKVAAPGRPKTITNLNTDNSCDICGKQFLQRRYLRAHYRLHQKKEASLMAQLRMAEAQYDGDSYDNSLEGYDDEDEDEDDDSLLLHPQITIEDGEMTLDENALKMEEGAQIKQEPKSPTHSGFGDGLTLENLLKKSNRKSLIEMNKVVKLSADIAEKSSTGSDNSSNESKDFSVMSVEEANLEEDDLVDLIDYDYKAMMQPEDDDGMNEDEDKGLECSVCGKEFTERATLRKHYRVHKKRFICRFCGLQLASAGSLMRHNLIHTGKKEFGCKLCSRKFSRKDTLMVHLQAHEKSSTRINMTRPYSCRICTASYTMKYNLIRHIKMCHSTMTAADRTAMLKQIERKYKNGIPSSSTIETLVKEEEEEEEGQKQNSENSGFVENEKATENVENVQIKSEPMDFLEMAEEEDDGNFDINEQDEERSPSSEDLQQCIQDELNPDETQEGFNCNHCGKIFKNAKSLNTHKWYHSREKQFICKICNRGFKYSTDLGRHINTHGNDKGASSSSGRRNVGPRSSALLAQQSQQDQTSYYPTQSYLSVPVVDRPFGCKICPQRFNHRSNLSRHVRLIHKATNPRNGVQQQQQPTNGQNYLHSQPPRNPMPPLQKMPQQQYQQQSQNKPQFRPQLPQLQQHGPSRAMFGMPKQLDPNRRRSSNSQVLTPDSYTLDPTSDRPYICNVCLKTFENKNNIWTHMRIHNKTFGCDFCGLKMATRGDWILHLRTHTGEKPYGCHLCEWKFSRKSGLNKHLEKYHGPGAKQLRSWKRIEHVNEPGSSRNDGLRFKITSTPLQNQFRVQTQGQNDSGMEISPIPMPNGSRKVQVLRKESGILKSALQNGPSSVDHNGLTITRTKVGSGGTLQTPTNKFFCKICRIAFPDKLHYVRHLNEHLKAREKSKANVAAATAAVNMPKNTGAPFAKQYICKECGKEYSNQAQLTQHILTHSDSDAPRCTLCGKACSSLGFLKRHYQYVHPDEPNPAEQSRARFTEIQKKNDESGEDLKPYVIKVKKGDDEESDEEFPHESDEYPNTVKPGTVQPLLFQEEDDEIEYVKATTRFKITSSTTAFPVPPPCERCGKEFTNKKARADHVWYCKRAKMFKCPVIECSREFKLKHDILRHLRRHTNERRFPCRICGIRFLHKQDANRHMRNVHNFQVKSRPYPCDFCDQHYVTDAELNNHLQEMHGVDLAEVYDTVEVEEPNFQGDEGYEQFLLDNGEEDQAQGEQVNEEIADPSKFLEQSMGVTDQSEDYHCTICNKFFVTRQKWLYHRYYHIREAKYDCSECPEKFKLRSHLERHMRTYHNANKPVYNVLMCKSCPRKFTREYDLLTHTQKVHNETLQPTQKQRMSMPSSSAASSKQITASSILQSTLALKQPSVSVTKVVPNARNSWPQSVSAPFTPQPKSANTVKIGLDGWYTCKICGKSFKEKKSIDAHRYYHNREEKHFCASCGAKFKQKSDLHRHIRIHHNSMNPKDTIHCPKCYRSFTDVRYLRMHVKRYHSNGQTENNQTGEEEEEQKDISNSKQFAAGNSTDQMDYDEMEWAQYNEEEEDNDQTDMKNIEYMEYKNDQEGGSGSGGEEGLQLTITCEACGLEVNAMAISDHNCSSDGEGNKTPNKSPLAVDESQEGVDKDNSSNLEKEVTCAPDESATSAQEDKIVI